MRRAAIVTVGTVAVITGTLAGFALGMFLELRRFER